jgi:unsaturated chondroitin disaccharide hydrolase
MVQAQTGCTPQSLQLAQQQLGKTIGYITTSQFPQLTVPPANHWNADPATDWTSGFFPGWIWYMYEQTLDPSLLTRAKAQTSSLSGELTDASGHDIGFRIMSSYGLGYQVTRDPSYMTAIQTAAQTTATLYQPGPGVINSWPYYSSTKTSVIIDNMATLELLFYAARNGGNSAWYNMAVSHALQTMKNNVRSDGSTYQGVEYNSDGTVYIHFTSDGYSTNSTWSRGQAWGLYGFTMAYHYTQDSRFLATAEKLADYFINNLPPDYIPYWDFSRSSPAPRDSSAAAIAAAGLLELSTYMTDPTLQSKYYNAALNIQTSLSNPALYLASPSPSTPTDGILLHGTYSVPANVGIDTSLIWGDYFFIQGCYRAMTPPAQVTNVSATTPASNQVALTWTAQSGAIRYSVKRSAIAGGPYVVIAPPPILTASTFTDATGAPNTTYFYVVSASSVAGEGPNSAEVAVTTPAGTPTTGALGSSLNPSAYGQPVTFTATVTSTAGTPAGTVTFMDGAAVLGSSSLNANGQATLTVSSLLAGSHSITAVYAGGGGFSGSTSPALTQTVNKASTSTSVSSSVNPSAAGQSVKFTAAVSPNAATGTVQFFDGSNSLGTANLTGGVASLSTSSLSTGSHSITASFSGDGNYNSSNSTSLSQTVNGALATTTTTVASSVNPSVNKQPVTFTATVTSGAGIPTGTVTFTDKGTTLGTGSLNAGGQATLTASKLSVGLHSITAVYGGNSSFSSSTSQVLTQTVKPK